MEGSVSWPGLKTIEIVRAYGKIFGESSDGEECSLFLRGYSFLAVNGLVSPFFNVCIFSSSLSTYYAYWRLL